LPTTATRRYTGRALSPVFVSELRLSDFRSHADLRLGGLPCGPVVITGPNGAGKTNLLEAISLLAPGPGLRRARTEDITRWGAAAPWAVWGRVEPGGRGMGTGLDTGTGRRRRSGEGSLACLWLTPAMDRVLSGPPAGRRAFLDRLVLALNPGHGALVTRYAGAMAERGRVLRQPSTRARASWLSGLEAQMAASGVAIAAARAEAAAHLSAAALEGDFPLPNLAWEDQTLPEGHAALEAEDALARALHAARALDAATGRCTVGPHRGDLLVTGRQSGTPAAHSSTGEQKALLLSIVLAQAARVAAESGGPPVLLLDEVAAHLDPQRRAALFSLLADLGGQVWLTGTEGALFAPLADCAEKLDLFGGTLTKIL
jgi:DNA replication and repair protein RecF